MNFDGWFEVESINPEGDLDLASVSYSLNGGPPVAPPFGKLITSAPANSGGSADVGYSNNGTGLEPTFESYSFPLPVEAQNQADVRIHFQFDSMDTLFNGFRGFAVDSVSISTNDSPLTQTFENGLGTWNADAASGPGAPFWHILNNPQNISVATPEINPDLVTLPDSGALPAPPLNGGSHVAWFGDDVSGTFCGPDYANRFVAPPPFVPPVVPPPAPPNPVGKSVV